ncbi:hypothetical protein KRM28CT15_45500 [Krasilnikovia sp. M28-CT-15]
MTGIRDTVAPLRLTGYRRLLLGRTINAVGNAFAPIALAFAVLDLTGSASDLGLVVGTRTLVNVLFVLFGGMLADRLPKTVLMVGAAVAAATTQAAIAARVLTGTATVPTLIGLSAVNGMVAAVSMPATSAIIAQLVPEDLRQQANGLNRLAFNSAAVMGAPVGGVVVAAVGPGWGILVDSAHLPARGLLLRAGPSSGRRACAGGHGRPVHHDRGPTRGLGGVHLPLLAVGLRRRRLRRQSAAQRRDPGARTGHR